MLVAANGALPSESAAAAAAAALGLPRSKEEESRVQQAPSLSLSEERHPMCSCHHCCLPRPQQSEPPPWPLPSHPGAPGLPLRLYPEPVAEQQWQVLTKMLQLRSSWPPRCLLLPLVVPSAAAAPAGAPPSQAGERRIGHPCRLPPSAAHSAGGRPSLGMLSDPAAPAPRRHQRGASWGRCQTAHMQRHTVRKLRGACR